MLLSHDVNNTIPQVAEYSLAWGNREIKQTMKLSNPLESKKGN